LPGTSAREENAPMKRTYESARVLDADLELRQRVLDAVVPPNGKPGRYRPEDKLLAFLKSL
jgi:hypothetical protein